jgi:HEAT repeat protein
VSDAATIDALAVPHRERQAFQQLVADGARALPLVTANLGHANARVRYHCARFLDMFLEPDAFGELLDMLDDPDADVRAASLHALACDRCKRGACRPDQRLVLPKAIALMHSDPDAHVRAHAVGLVGLSVHTRPGAVEALRKTHLEDASPAVRKKSTWYLPGGPIYRRTAPKPPRLRRAPFASVAR